MGVLEFLCDSRFHQSFFLPPNPETSRSKPFRVSYADYGESSSNAVVLLCGALMTTRFCYSPLDQLAKASDVRIIHPDRPGIGGTDQVEQHQRVAMWLEMVPQLLAHLRIKHISLASHSGGDIYALNTMLTFPHLLHPTTPYVMFFAPWVHPIHSGVTTLKAVELLPAPVIGQYTSLVRFINDKVMPLAGLSGTLVHEVKHTFHRSTPAPAPVPLTPTSLTPMSSRSSLVGPAARTALDLDDQQVAEEMRQLIVSFLFAENMDGIASDAQLFLKKQGNTRFSPLTNIDYAIPLLVKMIEGDNGQSGNGRTWCINSFHAQYDAIVGTKGRIWFDHCWKSTQRTMTATVEQKKTNLEYQSAVVPGTDHRFDSVVLLPIQPFH